MSDYMVHSGFAQQMQSDKEYGRYLGALPHCMQCGEPITDEECYALSIEDGYVCKECVRKIASYLPEGTQWLFYDVLDHLEFNKGYVKTPEADYDEWG